MISWYWLACWASHNASAAMSKAGEKCKDRIGMCKALSLSPYDRLMHSCRKNGPTALTGSREALFAALPERMLSSLFYFVGDMRTSFAFSQELPAGISECLRKWRLPGCDVSFANCNAPQLAARKRVLLCHGLSPVGDSILLLADLGRAYRVATALALPVEVMLTDVEWQLANRSIRQLQSISVEAVEQELIACRSRRLNLYTRLGIKSNLFAQRQSSLQVMSTFYQELAARLWQVNTSGILSIEQQKAISKQLPCATEEKYRQHLPLLRFLARHFNGFDAEFLWYFFNQYCAQRQFCSDSFKVAVESELRFDSAFAELASCLERWVVEKSLITETTAARADGAPGWEEAARENSGLAAAYLPHYQIAQLKLLPYTPLSLDAMKMGSAIKQDHKQIKTHIIGLDCEQVVDEIVQLLSSTPLMQRNRLAADLVSFLIFSCRQLGSGTVRGSAQKAGLSMESALAALAPCAVSVFEKEVAGSDSAAVRSCWNAGLEAALGSGNQQALPLHLAFPLFEDHDWGKSQVESLARLCIVARRLYRELSY